MIQLRGRLGFRSKAAQALGIVAQILGQELIATSRFNLVSSAR